MLDIAGRNLEMQLDALSEVGRTLRALYQVREPKKLTEVWDKLSPLLGAKASNVRFYFWTRRKEDETALTSNYCYPEDLAASVTTARINIFHCDKPEHFANLLPARENDAELRGISKSDQGYFEGTVKLGAKDGASVVELVDYGQYAHGRCRWYDRTPVLPQDQFLNSICSALHVLSSKSVTCANCCAITSILVGLVESQVFSQAEFLSMLKLAPKSGSESESESTQAVGE